MKTRFFYSRTERFDVRLEEAILTILANDFPHYHDLIEKLGWKMFIHPKENDCYILTISCTGWQASISPCIQFEIQGVGCVAYTEPNYEWIDDPSCWEDPELNITEYFAKCKIQIR